ncbi:hypothetical protein NQ318_016509 [Aromia moschata]|uniref:Uncharacterized protein n=1 Tax=Aromia moschata TaxID=1265417 RepID=A0AAV8YYD7_9CUCU|nr:hypothetical protein NQ318_016509 [Aromia moschata]
MSGHTYIKSTNPFDEDDDVDDETFLRNSRRPVSNMQPTFEDQMQTFTEKRKAIEDRTITSTEKSISLLRDSNRSA